MAKEPSWVSTKMNEDVAAIIKSGVMTASADDATLLEVYTENFDKNTATIHEWRNQKANELMRILKYQDTVIGSILTNFEQIEKYVISVEFVRTINYMYVAVVHLKVGRYGLTLKLSNEYANIKSHQDDDSFDWHCDSDNKVEAIKDRIEYLRVASLLLDFGIYCFKNKLNELNEFLKEGNIRIPDNKLLPCGGFHTDINYEILMQPVFGNDLINLKNEYAINSCAEFVMKLVVGANVAMNVAGFTILGTVKSIDLENGAVIISIDSYEGGVMITKDVSIPFCETKAKLKIIRG